MLPNIVRNNIKKPYRNHFELINLLGCSNNFFLFFFHYYRFAFFFRYCPADKLTFHSLIQDESVYSFHHLKILCFDEDIHTEVANSVLRKYLAKSMPMPVQTAIVYLQYSIRSKNVKLTSPCIIYPSLIFATVIYYNQYIFIYGICQLYN